MISIPQIEAGADVNIASDNEKEDGKGTPLVLAARNNLHDVIPALLNKGADEWAKDCRNNMMALHYAAQSKDCKSTNKAVVLFLKNKQTNFASSSSILVHSQCIAEIKGRKVGERIHLYLKTLWEWKFSKF